MSYELSELEKNLQKTKKQFLTNAKRATRELDRQRKNLRKGIKQANTRTKRARLATSKEDRTAGDYHSEQGQTGT